MFYSEIYRCAKFRFGNNLTSWVIYHHISLRQTYEDVNLSLNDLFGFTFIRCVLNRIKPWMAERHRITYFDSAL
jgi:hypothetical protein